MVTKFVPMAQLLHLAPMPPDRVLVLFFTEYRWWWTVCGKNR